MNFHIASGRCEIKISRNILRASQLKIRNINYVVIDIKKKSRFIFYLFFQLPWIEYIKMNKIK